MDETQEKEQKHPGGRPRILDCSLDDALILIAEYFNSPKGKEKPTISGLALYLGFADSRSIKDYIDRNDEFSAPIKKAVGRIEEEHESRLYGPNCTGSIFWLKNKGWRDSHDITSGGEKITPQIVSFLDATKPVEQKPESTNPDVDPD